MAVLALLQFPAVQGFIGQNVSTALSQKLGTQVSVGKVNLGFLNRIIIDDVHLLDQRRAPLLDAVRLAAKIDLPSLYKGQVRISSVQLFGTHINLYRRPDMPKPNFAFILDSLSSSKDNSRRPLDVQINAIVIRNGNIAWNDYRYAPTRQKFDMHHIVVSRLNTHMVLHTLTDDSLSLHIKKMSFREQAGLQVEKLSFRACAGKHGAAIGQLLVELPHSRLQSDSISVHYALLNGRPDTGSVRWSVPEMSAYIVPADMAFVLPDLRHYMPFFHINVSATGTSHSLRIPALRLAHGNSLQLLAEGSVNKADKHTRYELHVKKFHADNNFPLPQKFKNHHIANILQQVSYVDVSGKTYWQGNSGMAKGTLKTGVGAANFQLNKAGQQISGLLSTQQLQAGKFLKMNSLGDITAQLKVNGTLPHNNKPAQGTYHITGTAERITFKNNAYTDVTVDGTYRNKAMEGHVGLSSPYLALTANGTMNLSGARPSVNLHAVVEHFNPNALQLTDDFKDMSFSATVDANLVGNTPTNLEGTLNIEGLNINTPHANYALGNISAEAGRTEGSGRHWLARGSFGEVELEGKLNAATLVPDIMGIVSTKLPGLTQVLPAKLFAKSPLVLHGNNHFTLQARLLNTDWLQALFNIPLVLHKPSTIFGKVEAEHNTMTLDVDIPSFTFHETRYEAGQMTLTTRHDSLLTQLSVKRGYEAGKHFFCNLSAQAAHNILNTDIMFESNVDQRLSGHIFADTHFTRNEQNKAQVNMQIEPSDIHLNDSVWKVQPANITYSAKNLEISQLGVHHQNQHILINGRGTEKNSDSIFVDLQHVDVGYILNMINFHSVEFSGNASGRAHVAGLFRTPEAGAHLQVDNFKFQEGRMGTLFAQVAFNQKEKQIDIDAVAKDEGDSKTVIQGYVSPKRNFISLDIKAHHSRAEFIESFCSSFMQRPKLYATGNVLLEGPLNAINLTGKLVTEGSFLLSTTNVTYHVNNVPIVFSPDIIRFDNDTIYDDYRNKGIVHGALHHHNLKDLSYNVNIQADKLLAYNFKEPGEEPFYGTVFATGECMIEGKSGEVNIDAHVTPEKGSEFVYNVTNPESVKNSEFIHWVTRTDSLNRIGLTTPYPEKKSDIGERWADLKTDIRLNFQINTTPDATLKLIMDPVSGDYITLNGSGVLQANYYNKGNFDMYGNYTVNRGDYKLTIQNVIKKDFRFLEGGTIAFGGDPYNATLNLQTIYTVNGVSLADLQIGKSFTKNNIRVDCLMNISGTPQAPKVTFGLNLPTLGADAQQLIYNSINGDEELNQQVLYLLAVGRFYNQTGNNAKTGETQSQTSLAMQSLLSGTISQQINTVLSNVLKTSNWNFGANISPGNEGFNNAEYEGILSGKLFNNRLLINGQFGYRDNANATTGFIGDFDIRYLMIPNGNIAIKVYNQSNDRYFTRNSLTTQGVGLILKKDFNNWGELFRISRKKKVKQP